MGNNTAGYNDLLILPNEDTDTLVMDKEVTNKDIVATSDNLLSFSEEENLLEDNNDISNISDSSKETKDLDFGNLVVEDSVEEIKSEESNLSFGDLSEESENISITNDSVGTMEDILDKAISDLNSRSESIGNQKKLEEEKISNLKGKIKDLKEQEKELESKIITINNIVSELDNEKEMINKNTKSLERMKNINPENDIKTTISRKVHNTKRKAA